MEGKGFTDGPSNLTPQAEAPKVPVSIEDLDVPAAVLENLVIKHLAAYPKSDILELSSHLGVISHFVENVIAVLRKRAMVEVFQAEAHSLFSDTSKGNVRYALSEQGLEEADNAFKKDAYLGPMPVSLKQYSKLVEEQDVRAQFVTRKDVDRALSDVYGGERLAAVLGPAINSGRALLLYGHAGTGKSYVAVRILNALNSSVYIPYAVFAAGNIMRVFSPQHHTPIDKNHKEQSVNLKDQHDKRWVLCERPNVQVGGELTMDMLEVNHTEHSKVWLAPMQMMANNGIFIIDDLGRQPMPVDTILNRWIVPMEYNIDHLGLPNGQQITVPFILTLAFSTNLNPQKIADPAFLRRLGYKIQFYALEERHYRELWATVTEKNKFTLADGALTKLFELHRKHNVGLYPCLPKDIAGISRDIVVFEELEPNITPEIMQRAWDLYFTADEQGETS